MKYRLSCHVTVSAYTEIEADSEEEAIRLASDRLVVLDSNADDQEDNWVISDADGSPLEIQVTE